MANHYGFISPPLPPGAEPIDRHDALVPSQNPDWIEGPQPLIATPSLPSRKYRITIGNYIIYLDRLLGSGGTAEVYLCRDKVLGELRAVKRIDKEKLNEKALKMIIKEYDIVSQLDHPNIIKFYDYKEFDRYIYIFMDYYPEGDLITYEEQFAYINECTAWLIFRQVLDALVYLHEHNVIHRDIKLENILLKDSVTMTVVLADFGFAEILPKNNRFVTDVKGTPVYIAPEMFTGKPYNGYYADIWALGVTLYAMVCGHMPFDDDDIDSLAKKIMYDPLVFPPHVTSECRQLIRALLTRDPKNRTSLYEIYDSEWYIYWKFFIIHSKCLPNPKKISQS
jgi:serine/threonine protein kinase